MVLEVGAEVEVEEVMLTRVVGDEEEESRGGPVVIKEEERKSKENVDCVTNRDM